jgi:cytochrome bd-type quinol oxidase subunit 2
MRERIESIVLGILSGLLGAWICLDGVGLFRTGLHGLQGPIQVVGGLIFFFAGSWMFFKGTQGPAARNLPIYPWIRYLMILPILAGLGFFLFFSGIDDGEISTILLGIVPLLGALWYAIARFPSRRKKP